MLYMKPALVLFYLVHVYVSLLQFCWMDYVSTYRFCQQFRGAYDAMPCLLVSAAC